MMSRSYKYILFDLDGTLTDSGPGIMNAFAYAIKKMGRAKPEESLFRQFVGPILKDSFGRLLGFPEEEIPRAIAFYREYYFELGGALENNVYPGIPELLSELKTEGKTLIVATSKSARGTEMVLKHFGLKKYFDFIATSDDEIRPHKSDVIRYAFQECGITDISQAVMIGDRQNDIAAAKETGIDSIGVLYGYGSREELVNAGAVYLAESPPDIRALVG